MDKDLKPMPDLMPDTLSTDDMGLYIYATMPDGSKNMMFDIRVRGWGNLTGGGARNMNEADAIKVQKMWADKNVFTVKKKDLSDFVDAIMSYHSDDAEFCHNLEKDYARITKEQK